jgi:transposase
VAASAGRKIRLVCANDRFPTPQAVTAWLEAPPAPIAVEGRPPSCPSLNRSERRWGHLKRPVLANVLFPTLEELMPAVRKGVGPINGHRQRMGFMVRHKHQVQQAA